MTEVDYVTAYCGLCRQVVLVQRCISMTEVDYVPAYCGLCRQVVLGQVKFIVHNIQIP